MRKSLNKKYFLIILAAFLAGGFFVLSAHPAKAWTDTLVSLGVTAIYNIILSILSVIQKFFGLFLTLASSILDSVFAIGKFSNIPVVDIGWKITRSLCNMFIALVLLVMAISTILQIERFGWKTLLKRVVIVALLVNFSLRFAGIIIDFSQIMTSYFITAAKGNSSISKQLMNGLNIVRAFDAMPNPKEVSNQACESVGLACGQNQVCEQSDTGGASYKCQPAPKTTDSSQKNLGKGNEATLNIIIGYLFGIILTVIATFVVLAAAILLIFRIAVLWFLLIFSPLAWVSYITGTGGIWNKWWDNFFKWTFFAPIYAFFIYLAVLAAGSGSISQTLYASVRIDETAPIFNTLAGNVNLILQYIVIVIILVFGLIVSQKLGIMGAGTITSWGKKTGINASKWMGKQSLRPVSWGANAARDKMTSFAGGLIKNLPLLRKTGERMQAKATQLHEAEKEKPQHKAYANLLKSMSDASLANEVKNARGVRSLIAAREAKERGLLNRTNDRDVVRKAMKTLNSYGIKDDKGKTKESKELEETRFDVIEDKTEQANAIRKSYESGNIAKIDPAMFGKIKKDEKGNAVKDKDGNPVFEADEIGKQTMLAIQNELKTPPEFIDNFYKKLSKKAKVGAEAAMTSSFAKNSTFAENAPDMPLRKAYALATGKIAKAFEAAEDASEKIREAADNAAREFIVNMKPGQIGDIYPDVDGTKALELIGKHINAELLANVRDVSMKQKKIIKDAAEKAKNTSATNYMKYSYAWGGTPPLEGRAQKRPESQETEKVEGAPI